jgi:hypothetical protein
MRSGACLFLRLLLRVNSHYAVHQYAPISGILLTDNHHLPLWQAGFVQFLSITTRLVSTGNHYRGHYPSHHAFTPLILDIDQGEKNVSSISR